LRASALAILAAVACSAITGGDEPVAIEFVAAPDTIGVGDTVFVAVRVLNRDGDSIPGAPVGLTSLDTTLGIDTARQAVIGCYPGPGRVVASSGNLLSDPLRIIVTPDTSASTPCA
jgi:hypothetical protein